MRGGRLAILIGLTCGALAAGREVQAQVIDFQVDSTLDQIDDDVADGICHTAAGTCTLRAAVMTANRVTGNGSAVIHLPAGVYLLTRPPIGANGDDGGDLNFTPAMVGFPQIQVRGAGAATTSIDAQLMDRVIRVHTGAQVGLFDLRLRFGFADGGADGGGCVRNFGDLRLYGVVIEFCSAGSGGGVRSTGFGSYLGFDSVTLFANDATGGAGTGVGGGIAIDGNAGIAYSDFLLNAAAGGGGIFVEGNGLLLMVGGYVGSNTGSVKGGGILSAGVATLYETLVELNNAPQGGGASVETSGSVEINDSIFSENSSSGAGGGIYTGGVFHAYRSTATANTAETGAGIEVGPGGDLRLVDSTVSSNSATDSGAGVYLEGTSVANLYSSTIAFNRGDSDQDGVGDGGGIFNESALVNLRNTLVAGNYVFDPQTDPDDCAGTVHSYGRNLFGDVGGCTVVTGSGSWGLLNDLGWIGPLAINGGPTPTHSLLVGSNAIDGGDPVLGCQGPNGLLTIDQRSQPRAVGVRCDVGAFEYGPLVFSDSFESGGVGAWSSAVGGG